MRRTIVVRIKALLVTGIAAQHGEAPGATQWIFAKRFQYFAASKVEVAGSQQSVRLSWRSDPPESIGLKLPPRIGAGLHGRAHRRLLAGHSGASDHQTGAQNRKARALATLYGSDRHVCDAVRRIHIHAAELGERLRTGGSR